MKLLSMEQFLQVSEACRSVSKCAGASLFAGLHDAFTQSNPGSDLYL